MLFMVIERFRGGDPSAVGARFRVKGRMIDEGVEYVASWMEAGGERCYQLMEAPEAQALQGWIGRWEDLVEFEVVPVLNSAEYWAGRSG